MAQLSSSGSAFKQVLDGGLSEHVLRFLLPEWGDVLGFAGCCHASKASACAFAKTCDVGDPYTIRYEAKDSRISITGQGGELAMYQYGMSCHGQQQAPMMRKQALSYILDEVNGFLLHIKTKIERHERVGLSFVRNQVILWILQKDFIVFCNVQRYRHNQGRATTTNNISLPLFGGQEGEDCLFLSCLKIPEAPIFPGMKQGSSAGSFRWDGLNSPSNSSIWR